MNKEEKNAIEKIKEIIECFYCFPNPTCIELKDCDCSTLEIALNLIEKLQKENEELKKEIERQKDINTVINEKGLDKNYEKALEKTMTKFLKNNIANDFISKQTVKDKIEELNKKILNAERFDERISKYRYQKQVLQELLEERN